MSAALIKKSHFFGSYVESIIQNTKVIVNPTAYHSSVTDPTVKCYN